MLEDHINVDNPNDDLEKAVAHHSYKSVFSASWGIDWTLLVLENDLEN